MRNNTSMRIEAVYLLNILLSFVVIALLLDRFLISDISHTKSSLPMTVTIMVITVLVSSLLDMLKNCIRRMRGNGDVGRAS